MDKYFLLRDLAAVDQQLHHTVVPGQALCSARVLPIILKEIETAVSRVDRAEQVSLHHNRDHCCTHPQGG